MSLPATAAPTTVMGKVGPGYTISLTIGGKKVKKLKAGVKYRFVVADRSEDHDFRLNGPGTSKVLSGEGFRGTKVTVLTLRKESTATTALPTRTRCSGVRRLLGCHPSSRSRRSWVAPPAVSPGNGGLEDVLAKLAAVCRVLLDIEGGPRALELHAFRRRHSHRQRLGDLVDLPLARVGDDDPFVAGCGSTQANPASSLSVFVQRSSRGSFSTPASRRPFGLAHQIPPKGRSGPRLCWGGEPCRTRRARAPPGERQARPVHADALHEHGGGARHRWLPQGSESDPCGARSRAG